MERKLGQPIGGYFDLIAGTSTGAIIAAALALGEPAKRIEDLYRQHGAAIFARPKRNPSLPFRLMGPILRLLKSDIDAGSLSHSKYSSEPLRHALTTVFGDHTLEQARQRLVIPAVDLTRAQTVVFKTPHLPEMDRDRHFKAVDVLMATTAAPTYFPMATIHQGSAYCDGGLWANNPSAVALAEALRIATTCRRPNIDPSFGSADVWMLSIGTGTCPYDISPPAGEREGLVFWAPKVFDATGVSQSQGMGFLTQFLLLPNQYARVDFQIPGRAWKLDAIECLDRLCHLGRETAESQFSELRPMYFDRLAQPLVPFPSPSVAGLSV